MLRSGGRTSISVSGRMNDRPYSTSLMLLTSAKVIIKFEYTMTDSAYFTENLPIFMKAPSLAAEGYFVFGGVFFCILLILILAHHLSRNLYLYLFLKLLREEVKLDT